MTVLLEDLLKQTNILHPDRLEGSEQPQDKALLALQDDLQGNILKSHGRNFSVQLFLRFKSEKIDDAKIWIRDFAEKFLTSATKQREYRQSYRKPIIESLQSKSLELSNTNIYIERMSLEQERQSEPDTLFTNFFLSFEGYKNLLKCTDKELKELKKHFEDSSFKNGMKNENGIVSLGDPPLCKWEENFAQEIHALILLADSNCDYLVAQAKKIESKVKEFAEIVHSEVGKIFRNENHNAVEHFGFVDGISQPLFFQDDIDKIKNQEGIDVWDPSASLKLVLVKDPLSPNEYGCGSYLVYRKLQQNVNCFKQKIEELANLLDVKQALAEAFVMGRFKDGTPVTLDNEALSPKLIPNNFDYRGDIHGTRCPFHTHIRKTNPRDDEVITNDENQRDKRIARRGISYSYKKGEICTWEEQLKYLDRISINETANNDVGVLFMCFQRSITNQFVTLQKTWANNMHFPKNDTGIDPVIGQGKQLDGGQHWPKNEGGSDENHKEQYDFSKCVQMNGGEYFFAPSISFLIHLPNCSIAVP